MTDPKEETMETIIAWANTTFSNPPLPLVCERMGEEVEELVIALKDMDSENIAEEIADVAIMFVQIIGRTGVDLEKEIQKKMAINRKRKWGATQHIEEES